MVAILISGAPDEIVKVIKSFGKSPESVGAPEESTEKVENSVKERIQENEQLRQLQRRAREDGNVKELLRAALKKVGVNTISELAPAQVHQVVVFCQGVI